MTGDEYRAELRRVTELNRAAQQDVAVYAKQVMTGSMTTEADARAFEDAVGRIDQAWPVIVQLLRQAPDVNS